MSRLVLQCSRPSDPLPSAILTSLKGNYPRPAPEALAYQRQVAIWKFEDIVRTPSPTPENVAALRAQLSELLAWLGERMRSDLGLKDGVVEGALAYARAVWLDDHIDNPFYRFDRKPLSPEAMAAARALLQGEVDSGRNAFLALTRAELPEGAREQLAVQEARSLARGAIYSVVREHCGWRKLPPELMEQLRAGTAAQHAASEAALSAMSLEPLRFLLHALAAGRVTPAGAPPGME
jgi:hypothetical protein